MKNILVFVGLCIASTVAFAVIIIGLGSLGQSVADQTNAQANLAMAQGMARATVIQAEAVAMLHASVSAAINSAAMFPWGVMIGVYLLSVLVLCVIGALVWHRQLISVERRTPQLVERHYLYLPPPDMTRQEMWRLPQRYISLGAGEVEDDA